MAKILQKALDGVISPEQARAVETGIDVIGDIAIVKLMDSAKENGSIVGDAILSSIKHVKAVFDQEGGLEGDFRLRKLRHIAGENRTLTMHHENGLRFMVDVEKCYFSPRLSTERMRVAELASEGELVLNMFAGVGPYSITIAKKKKATVFSCELNAYAFGLHVQNNTLNKVDAKMRMFNEDASRLPEVLDVKFDRILMPHPSQSDKFLPAALELAKPGAWIHYYRLVSGYNASEAGEVLRAELVSIMGEGHAFKLRKGREIGPRYLEFVADIQLQ